MKQFNENGSNRIQDSYDPYNFKPQIDLDRQASKIADKIMNKVRNGLPNLKNSTIDRKIPETIPSTKVSEKLIIHDDTHSMSQRSQSQNNLISAKQSDLLLEKFSQTKNNISVLLQSIQTSQDPRKIDNHQLFELDQRFSYHGDFSDKQYFSQKDESCTALSDYFKNVGAAEKYLNQNMKQKNLSKNTNFYTKQIKRGINLYLKKNQSKELNKENPPISTKTNTKIKNTGEIKSRKLKSNISTPIKDFQSCVVTPLKQQQMEPLKENTSQIKNKTENNKEEQNYDQNYAKDLLAQLLLVKKVKDQFLMELKGIQ